MVGLKELQAQFETELAQAQAQETVPGSLTEMVEFEYELRRCALLEKQANTTYGSW